MLRVALDTNIIRDAIQGDPVTLRRLHDLSGQFLYSIPELAVLELALQLLEGRIPWNSWTERRSLISKTLDPFRPVVDGKSSIRVRRPAARRAAYRSHFREVPASSFWQYLVQVREHALLQEPFDSTDPLGAPMQAKLDADRLRKIIEDSRAGWNEFIVTTRQAFANASNELEGLGLDALSVAQRNVLNRLYFGHAYHADNSRLDAYLETTIRLARLSEAKNAYNPLAHINDALDLNMLIVLQDVDLLITSDRRLAHHVAAAMPERKSPVLTPEAFIRTYEIAR